ncbi:14127_t:CDS:2 [Funneliformis caledonium]|uniref:14127_t:CDS:1 n=2 Tax=Funneliformis TaxID=1117308 RepID=A0A9N9ANT5_9GLOM|nr:14127_t:CDS:2 [Funneliformis caledonium]CAG8667328.1 8988_t:CDS:2 [Funneliformis mosseae]
MPINTNDLRFFAEDELVAIEPFFKEEALILSGKSFGPFEPPKKLEMPLWAALALKERKQCKIFPPECLTIEFLENRLELEDFLDINYGHKPLSNLPKYFIEFSKILLENAEDDIENPARVRYLLQKLKEIRENKIEKKLNDLEVNGLKMKNLTTSEVHKIRPTFTMALGGIRKLDGGRSEDPKRHPVQVNGMQEIEQLEVNGRGDDMSLEDYRMDLDDTIIYD